MQLPSEQLNVAHSTGYNKEQEEEEQEEARDVNRLLGGNGVNSAIR